MPLDPINPIGPRPAQQPGAIPAVRRAESSTEKGRDERPPARRRAAQVPDPPPPPDDGRPHIDVRV